MRILATVFTALLLAGCSSERVQIDHETADFLSAFGCPSASGLYTQTTISALTSEPERFNGKPVKVSGYYTRSFEHSAIYPTPQDPFSADFSKGIWTLMSTEASPKNGDSATLRGVYITSTRGHLGQWPGSICVHSVSVSK
ncbi:hypothetical protein [Pseudoxanthomonas mexicana]